jgi:hypothetical protein
MSLLQAKLELLAVVRLDGLRNFGVLNRIHEKIVRPVHPDAEETIDLGEVSEIHVILR